MHDSYASIVLRSRSITAAIGQLKHMNNSARLLQIDRFSLWAGVRQVHVCVTHTHYARYCYSRFMKLCH